MLEVYFNYYSIVFIKKHTQNTVFVLSQKQLYAISSVFVTHEENTGISISFRYMQILKKGKENEQV